MLKTTELFGVNITNERESKILEYILQRLKSSNKKLIIYTPNPEILVYALKHNEYKKILNKADIALPDGIGLFIAAGVMGRPFEERIPGVDFIEELCKASEEKPISIGLLGGKAGIAERAAECLKAKYPWIDVVFTGSVWPYKLSNPANLPIDILFVAFGFPKQEEWIYKNLKDLPVKAAMGVGGAFDYISGEVTRAPFLVRAIGFEWLFRLIRQPWRIKRQLALISFAGLVLREIVGKISLRKVS